MQHLEAPFINHLNRNSPVEDISASLDKGQKHPIAIAPWPEFSYVPKVQFSIAHGGDCIFLKYFVSEAVVKAVYNQPNDPVYKDSCVEFFIAFNDDKDYYNLEFNAIGTCTLYFGKDRNNRKPIAEELIDDIRYLTTIKNEIVNKEKPGVNWQLSLMIPVQVFSNHRLGTLSGQACFVNFYKCGDDLPVPHFLAWSNIKSLSPNFHLREYFGKLSFL